MRTRGFLSVVTWLTVSLWLAVGCTQLPVTAGPAAQPTSGALSGGPTAAPTINTVFATPAASAPQPAPPGRIVRNEILEEVVEMQGRQWRMSIVELIFGPGAETPVHSHPGPSSGFMQNGRIVVSVVGEGNTSTFAAGSAIHHPWDRPHVFRNPSDDSVRMLSFELTPL